MSTRLKTAGLRIEDEEFFVHHLSAQWRIRSAHYPPLSLFHIEEDTYNIRFGQESEQGGTVFNIFIEPQITILHKGAGQPQFQICTAPNMQFGS